MSLEVQSAQEIRAARAVALELELARPDSMLLIGGTMRWDYDIDGPIVVLRRSDLEWELGVAKLTHSKEEIIRASLPVLAAVQGRLESFAGADCPVPGLLDPWRLQVLAKRALRDWLEVREVRAVQREAAGEHPLTICFGHTRRVAYEAVVGAKGLPSREAQGRARAIANERDVRLPAAFYSHGDGCGRAHPESKSPNRLFKLYCDRCAKRAGNRQRELERYFWAEKNGVSIGKGTFTCACGKTFDSTRTGQLRCPDCRRQHRKCLRTRQSRSC